MGLAFWKNNRQIDAFAQAVADDLFSYVQPDIANALIFACGKLSKKQKIKTEQKFNDIFLQIKRFSESQSLGIYGKARLQKKFNERLEELGYETVVVNKISEDFLIQNV
jgi:hypothetical protein